MAQFNELAAMEMTPDWDPGKRAGDGLWGGPFDFTQGMPGWLVSMLKRDFFLKKVAEEMNTKP